MCSHTVPNCDALFSPLSQQHIIIIIIVTLCLTFQQMSSMLHHLKHRTYPGMQVLTAFLRATLANDRTSRYLFFLKTVFSCCLPHIWDLFTCFVHILRITGSKYALYWSLWENCILSVQHSKGLAWFYTWSLVHSCLHLRCVLCVYVCVAVQRLRGVYFYLKWESSNFRWYSLNSLLLSLPIVSVFPFHQQTHTHTQIYTPPCFIADLDAQIKRTADHIIRPWI